MVGTHGVPFLNPIKVVFLIMIVIIDSSCTYLIIYGLRMVILCDKLLGLSREGCS